MIRHRLHNSPLFLHMLIQMDPLHATTAYFLNTLYNITPPLMLTPSRLSLCLALFHQSFPCLSFPPHACHIARQPHPPWLHHTKKYLAKYTNSRCCGFEVKKYCHTIITPTKCTLLLLKAPDITICTLCHYIFAPTCFNPRGSSSGGSMPVPG
jgi:hypothetical protein